MLCGGRLRASEVWSIRWAAHVGTDSRIAASTSTADAVAENFTGCAANVIVDALLTSICAANSGRVCGTTAVRGARVLIGNKTAAVRSSLKLRG